MIECIVPEFNTITKISGGYVFNCAQGKKELVIIRSWKLKPGESSSRGSFENPAIAVIEAEAVEKEESAVMMKVVTDEPGRDRRLW